jgi:cysteine desulfurase/selenocysteine lyase
MNELDIAAIRADTPGCQSVVHFNNAGASLMPRPVYQAVTDHLALELTRGGYEAAAVVQEKIDSFYPAVATLLNAKPTEIAYVENATRAWDMAFYAIPFEKGDRVITHRSEYGSNYLALLQLAGKRGIHIDLAPSTPTGQVDVERLEDMITSRTRLVAITHVPSHSGLVNPVAEVGRITRDRNILFLLDACQSTGQMPVDVEKIGCDMLAATGRKFLRGPRGTGFLYVRSSILDSLTPPFVDLQAADWIASDAYALRDDARRFENWERFVSGQIGLAEAARYAQSLGLEAIQNRVRSLARKLCQGLNRLPGVEVQEVECSEVEARSGIVTFAIKGLEAQATKAALQEKNINVSVIMAKNARLDLECRGINELVRASVHYFNTADEVEYFCDRLAQLV